MAWSQNRVRMSTCPDLWLSGDGLMAQLRRDVRTALVAIMMAGSVLIAPACGDDDAPQSPSASPETAVPGATETPAAAEELLYARVDGSGWIYDTGTGEQRQIIESGVCERWATASWNHDGSLLAMTCGTTAASDVFITHIMDAEGAERDRLEGFRTLGWAPAGNLLLLLEEVFAADGARGDQLAIYDAGESATDAITRIEGATTGVFSPEVTSLAYYRPPGAPCTAECETGLVIRNIDDGSERGYGDVAPAAWVLGGDAIIVRPPAPITAPGGASIMSVSTGEMTPLPADAESSGFWVTPDGSRVVFLSRAEGLGLGVLHATALEVTQISGSRISYPSDHIPEQHVALTDDLIYWFDATGERSPWFSARYDGTALTHLGEAATLFMTFSVGRQFVAYPTVDTGGGESLTEVARIDGTQQVELGASGFVMAWRPGE